MKPQMITTQSKRFLKDYFNALEARIPEEDVEDADKIGDMLYDMMDAQYGYDYESLAHLLLASKDLDWDIAEQRFNKLNEHEKTT